MAADPEQRPRSFIEEARRRQIVDAAIETIAEVGFSGASLNVVARRAGVSKGIISYHFGSKQALLEQIVIDVYTAGATEMIPRIQEQPSAPEQLRTYVVANLDYIANNRRAIAVATEVITNLRRPDGRPRFGAEENEWNLQGVEQILREGQRTGRFREFDTRVMALAIRSAIDGIAHLYTAGGIDVDMAAYAEELAAIFDRATRA
jgi:TetR/AcrR family transcriptional regulator, fatty acid metabolism regulator protein